MYNSETPQQQEKPTPATGWDSLAALANQFPAEPPITHETPSDQPNNQGEASPDTTSKERHDINRGAGQSETGQNIANSDSETEHAPEQSPFDRLVELQQEIDGIQHADNIQYNAGQLVISGGLLPAIGQYGFGKVVQAIEHTADHRNEHPNNTLSFFYQTLEPDNEKRAQLFGKLVDSNSPDNQLLEKFGASSNMTEANLIINGSDIRETAAADKSSETFQGLLFHEVVDFLKNGHNFDGVTTAEQFADRFHELGDQLHQHKAELIDEAQNLDPSEVLDEYRKNIDAEVESYKKRIQDEYEAAQSDPRYEEDDEAYCAQTDGNYHKTRREIRQYEKTQKESLQHLEESFHQAVKDLIARAKH